MPFVRSIGRLLTTLVALSVIGGVTFLSYILISIRLELVKPQFFVLGLALMVLLLSLWLRAQGFHNAGNLFAGLSTLTMAAISLQALWPGVYQFITVNRARLDRFAAVAASPRPVPCEEPFFLGAGEPRYWVGQDDDPVVCYNGPGHHPFNGRPLVGITPPVARLARMERERPDSVSAPIPSPIPAAVQVERIVIAPLSAGEPTPEPTPMPTSRPGVLTIITAPDGTTRIVPPATAR